GKRDDEEERPRKLRRLKEEPVGAPIPTPAFSPSPAASICFTGYKRKRDDEEDRPRKKLRLYEELVAASMEPSAKAMVAAPVTLPQRSARRSTRTRKTVQAPLDPSLPTSSRKTTRKGSKTISKVAATSSAQAPAAAASQANEEGCNGLPRAFKAAETSTLQQQLEQPQINHRRNSLKAKESTGSENRLLEIIGEYIEIVEK
ncbi:hypothetical protein HDV05_000386, partial [Chytridiales sp. JEL 0842]